MSHKLLLVFVSYHTSIDEVDRLAIQLESLPNYIGYAVAVNEYDHTQPIEKLSSFAVKFIRNSQNLGYGTAVNQLIDSLTHVPDYICVMNTDICWDPYVFTSILDWIEQHHDVNLAVPLITDSTGTTQYLCKRNPTFLGLLSRRFIPSFIKPAWLIAYDKWYCMADYSYETIFDVPYLSGCCMFIKTSAFLDCGGFDEQFFLYLEDADITRQLAVTGRCVHYPHCSVVHYWGRGNYISLRLTIVNLISAWKYFQKWGFKLW